MSDISCTVAIQAHKQFDNNTHSGYIMYDVCKFPWGYTVTIQEMSGMWDGSQLETNVLVLTEVLYIFEKYVTGRLPSCC